MNNAQVIASSKTVTLHSLDLKQPLSTYTHHRGIINAATINHNNKVIATCGQDGKIFLVSSQKPQNKLIEHSFYPNYKEKIYSLSTCAFSPNSKYLAVGSIDSLIKIWDLRGDKNTQKEPLYIKSHMGGVSSLAWIKALKGENNGTQILASSSSSGDIYVHSNKGGIFNETMSMKIQQGINCIRVSESNDFCRLAACTNSGTLSIWDMFAGNPKPMWSTSWNSERKPSINSLSFSPFSPVLLVTASSDNNLVFYDIHQKKSVKTISTDEALNCVGLHSNGHTLVAGGMFGSILVYDLRSPNKPTNKLIGHQTSIKHLQFFKNRERETMPVTDNRTVKTASFTGAQNTPSIVNMTNISNRETIIDTKPNSIEQIKLKDPIKPPQAKMNNFININKPSIIVSDEGSKDRKTEVKPNTSLSHTGQEVIRNATNPIKKTEIPTFSESASEFPKFRPKQPLKHQSLSINGSNELELVRTELRELKNQVSQLQAGQRTLKDEIYDMQERINMNIVKQFQIQYQEMQQLFKSFLLRDKEKDEQLKQLQAENKRLKSTTF